MVGFLRTISAYRCYLEDNKIEAGTAEDPLRIFEESVKALTKEGEPELYFDLVTPFYVLLLGKKWLKNICKEKKNDK